MGLIQPAMSDSADNSSEPSNEQTRMKRSMEHMKNLQVKHEAPRNVFKVRNKSAAKPCRTGYLSLQQKMREKRDALAMKKKLRELQAQADETDMNDKRAEIIAERCEQTKQSEFVQPQPADTFWTRLCDAVPKFVDDLIP